MEYSVCSSPEIISIQSTCASPEIILDARVVENVQILEKLGIKDEILPKLKDWMKKVVLPHHTSLLAETKEQTETTVAFQLMLNRLMKQKNHNK